MFKASLEQERIFEEVKNGTNNILINAKAGSGKCLGINTNVIMYDGTRRKVQDIKEGDLLMGDDGTPRTVLNIGRGKSTLYKVTLSFTGEFFICNEDHILTCTSSSNKIVSLDISVKDLLENYKMINYKGKRIFESLSLYRSIVSFNEENGDNKSKKIDYYNLGYTFCNRQRVLKNWYQIIICTTLENRLDFISGFIDKFCVPQKTVIKLIHPLPSKKFFNVINTILRSVGYEYIESENVIQGNYKLLKVRNGVFKDYIREDNENQYKSQIKRFYIKKYKNNGDYYGFTIDGNGRFLIEDFIVTHNTTTITKAIEYIPEDKSIILLAFNKHIATELVGRVPKRDKLKISTTHALGWGAIRRKYKDAILDDDKAFKVIRRKLARWNTEWVDDIDEYVNTIKKLVDLCRTTLTTRREFVMQLAERQAIQITEEDARRVLSVMEEMLNDTKTFDFIDMVYVPAVDNKVWLFPNDYVFVDECVSEDLTVLLKDGGYKSIRELYDQYYYPNGDKKLFMEFPEILSYNLETGEPEYKRIKNIVNKDRKIYMRKTKIVNDYFITTESHLFYTSEGWREQKDLKVGDYIISNKPYTGLSSILPNDAQIDMLYAFLVSFNMIKATKNSGFKFRFYLKGNEKRKKNFLNSQFPIFLKYLNKKFNIEEYSTLPFYINEMVFTKEYAIKNLTDKQLALTYIMTGKYFKDIDKYAFYLSVNSFDEAVIGKDLFEKRFGIKFDIKNFKKGNYLIPRDQNWFFEKICPYLPTFMKRYIPEQFHDKINLYQYSTIVNEYGGKVTGTKILPHNFVNIFDLEVEDNHNYFIGPEKKSKNFSKRINNPEAFVGYLVHNCQDYNRAQQFILNKIVKKDTGRLISVGDNSQAIYSFMGAASDSFDWFRNKENTTELPLTTSYRCAKRIIEYAQTIVPTINYKHDAEDGEVINGSVLELAKAGDFVLARKNKPLVILLFDLLRQNKMATIRGNDIGVKLVDTIKGYKTLNELNEGLNQKLNEIRDYLVNNIGVIDFRNDPRYIAVEDNVEIIRFLMNNSGSVERIIEKLTYIFTDKPEGIILSTIHKSKGLEADTVFIIKPDEIRLKTPVAEAAIQEKNLEYIAITRAKRRLILDTEWTDERT